MKIVVETCIIRAIFDGEIISSNVESLRVELLTALKENKCTAIILDMSNTKMVDSKGLNLLIATQKECAKRNVTLKFENPSANLLKLFTLLGLTKKFGIE